MNGIRRKYAVERDAAGQWGEILLEGLGDRVGMACSSSTAPCDGPCGGT
jgi:hypothetical protein